MDATTDRPTRYCSKCSKAVSHANERMRDRAEREGRLCYSCAKTRIKAECVIDDCTAEHYGLGFCRKHWMRNRRHGDPNYQSTRGQGFLHSGGYRMLFRPKHPNSTKSGYVMEHIVTMVEKLGRPLEPHENVHHLNGVRDDNHIENLELWSTSQPSGQRVVDKVRWAKQMLALYGEEFDNE